MRPAYTRLLTAALVTFAAATASAQTIRNGFDSNSLARNDDGSTGLVNIGFTANFFGVSRTGLYVNNNGNITFDAALSTFTPFPLLNTNRQIIAPFFADVDTRGLASDIVRFGTGTVGARNAFGVNWLNVGYFPSATDKLNSFQLVLIDRSDIGAGDFDFEFNYGQIQWETGGASGGVGGLGGSCARAGWSNGNLASAELAGSATCGAFLDGGVNSLRTGSNINTPGRFLFQVRNGQVEPDPVPEPASLALLAAGVAGLAAVARRRRGTT